MSDLGQAGALARARDMIRDRAPDWTRLLQELIRIPSRYEDEHAIVRRVSEHVTSLGLTPTLVAMDAAALRRHPDSCGPISAAPGRDNVVVRLPGRGGGRSLVMNCHLDVQPEGDPREWAHPPFAGHIDPDANAIFGRGAMDDKAGVVLCLGLMRILVEHGIELAGDLVFHFVLEDEITGNGSLAALEAGHLADAAIILDGTRPDRAIDRHAGNMEFHASMKGRPASVGVSHLGANAAELLSRTLLHLRDAVFGLNTGRQPPWTQFPSPYQFVIQHMEADAPRFSVPVEARARCYVTFPEPHTLDAMRRFLEAEGRRHAEANGYPEPPVFEWEGFAAEPVSGAADELGALVGEVATRHGVTGFRVGPSTGTSDMRHFARRGIPCLLFGPGRGYNPHRVDEYFLLDDLPFMLNVYLDIVVGWCNAPRA
jgi:acetylornithine deacetylase